VSSNRRWVWRWIFPRAESPRRLRPPSAGAEGAPLVPLHLRALDPKASGSDPGRPGPGGARRGGSRPGDRPVSPPPRPQAHPLLRRHAGPSRPVRARRDGLGGREAARRHVGGAAARLGEDGDVGPAGAAQPGADFLSPRALRSTAAPPRRAVALRYGERKEAEASSVFYHLLI